MIISGADKIDHIGMVVNDIEKAVALYRNVFGLTPWGKGIQENETGQKMVILPLQGTFLELIEPSHRVENRFNEMLKQGEGVYWICFHVDNYDEKFNELKKKGIPVEEMVAKSFPGHEFRVAWVPPEYTHGVWIELAEKARIPQFLIDHTF